MFKLHWRDVVDLPKQTWTPVRTEDGRTLSIKLVSVKKIKAWDYTNDGLSYRQRQYTNLCGYTQVYTIACQETKARYVAALDYSGDHPDDCAGEFDDYVELIPIALKKTK